MRLYCITDSRRGEEAEEGQQNKTRGIFRIAINEQRTYRPLCRDEDVCLCLEEIKRTENLRVYGWDAK